jgi:glutamine cyclotransferase
MKTRISYLLLITLFLTGCNGGREDSKKSNVVEVVIPTIDFQNVKSYPHDTNSFTEGFLVNNGNLYESTGATKELPQTKSLFGVVNLKTGKIDKKVELDRGKYFGEGITFLNGKVYQLTYTTKIGFIYDAKTFKKIKDFTFPSKEGWGLTTDGTNLIMSDGTNVLTYLDPNTLQAIKTVQVTENSYAKDYLNELEYIKGYIYANIWGTNTIVKINPTDGKIIGMLDLTSLAEDAKRLHSGSLEMNGIAYDSVTDQIFVTGKMWPKIYEIKFNH